MQPMPDQLQMMVELSKQNVPTLNAILGEAGIACRGPRTEKAKCLVNTLPVNKLQTLLAEASKPPTSAEGTAAASTESPEMLAVASVVPVGSTVRSSAARAESTAAAPAAPQDISVAASAMPMENVAASTPRNSPSGVTTSNADPRSEQPVAGVILAEEAEENICSGLTGDFAPKRLPDGNASPAPSQRFAGTLVVQRGGHLKRRRPSASQEKGDAPSSFDVLGKELPNNHTLQVNRSCDAQPETGNPEADGTRLAPQQTPSVVSAMPMENAVVASAVSPAGSAGSCAGGPAEFQEMPQSTGKGKTKRKDKHEPIRHRKRPAVSVAPELDDGLENLDIPGSTRPLLGRCAAFLKTRKGERCGAKMPCKRHKASTADSGRRPDVRNAETAEDLQAFYNGLHLAEEADKEACDVENAEGAEDLQAFYKGFHLAEEADEADKHDKMFKKTKKYLEKWEAKDVEEEVENLAAILSEEANLTQDDEEEDLEAILEEAELDADADDLNADILNEEEDEEEGVDNEDIEDADADDSMADILNEEEESEEESVEDGDIEDEFQTIA